MTWDSLLERWLNYPQKAFSRNLHLDQQSIDCDCAGLVTLLCTQLSLPTPYRLPQPKAVHYFALIQEVGSNRIDNLTRGCVLAWRKDWPPKSGDTGHILVAVADPVKISEQRYRVSVVDSSRLHNGISCREIELLVDSTGRLTGVRFDVQISKVKCTAIYHHTLFQSRYCLGCGLPLRVCLCHQIEPNLVQPNVIILRHSDERKRTLATVSLIKQRYPSVLVKESELFEPPRRPNLRLLFPSLDIETSASDRSVDDNVDGASPHSPDTLILIDATWRKAKKILHLNPWLAALPRLALQPVQRSGYLLRRVPAVTALSSVEAFALAMNDQQLLHLLPKMMQQQIAIMGESTYRANYRDYLNFDGDK